MSTTHILFSPAPAYRDALFAHGRGGSRPPTACHHGAVTEHHERCLDCDARSYDHRHDIDHCTVCGEDWPCEHAGEVSEHRPEHWSEGNGESWQRPDALMLAWGGLPVSEGVDRLRGLCLAMPYTDIEETLARACPDEARGVLFQAWRMGFRCQMFNMGTVVVVTSPESDP